MTIITYGSAMFGAIWLYWGLYDFYKAHKTRAFAQDAYAYLFAACLLFGAFRRIDFTREMAFERPFRPKRKQLAYLAEFSLYAVGIGFSLMWLEGVT